MISFSLSATAKLRLVPPILTQDFNTLTTSQRITCYMTYSCIIRIVEIFVQSLCEVVVVSLLRLSFQASAERFAILTFSLAMASW